MFGKDKVKGHNRVIKGKSGFKVSRVGDFLRKKDESKKRNLALGVGATAVLGVGAGLLLKKKGLRLSFIRKGLKSATVDTPKYPKGTSIRTKTKDMVVKKFDQISDPWQTPIEYKVSKDLLRPSKRGNLTRKEMLIESNKTTNRRVAKSMVISAKNIEKTQEAYDSLPLELKVITQMEKALVRPQNPSNLGRPLDRTNLKTILNKPIEKATRKVKDRLVREKVIRDSKEKL